MIYTPNTNKVNVLLRDGTEYLGKDVGPKPMGDNDRVICFFNGKGGTDFMVIPLDLVKNIVFYWEDES